VESRVGGVSRDKREGERRREEGEGERRREREKGERGVEGDRNPPRWDKTTGNPPFMTHVRG
jgi:hypothetical protein